MSFKNNLKKPKTVLALLWTVSGLFLLCLIVLLVQNQFYRLKPKLTILPSVEQKLSALAAEALESNDVPVAALVFYNDSIIGEGFNTVYRDSNLSSHAEIRALNQVFKKNGNTFSGLNRAHLTLYSTFEPCEMCKGTLLHYGIKNIFFEQYKPASSQIKSLLKSLMYNVSIQRLEADSLQEKLFLQHPQYKK